jgi:hypothetical protein
MLELFNPTSSRIAKASALLLALASSGCYVRGGGLFAAAAFTAIATAAIISSERPPPPRYVEVPPPNPGYTWEPGYWTRIDGEWEWIDGRWIPNYRGYRWIATHWVEDPGGRWRLVPGRWVAYHPMGPPASPPPEDDVPGSTDDPLPPQPAK